MKLRVFFFMILAGILLSGLVSISSERTRPLPYLSIGDDADDDGVPDSTDVCDGEDASFFDRDGDGCIDDVTGTRHIEYWDAADLPFVYYIHEDGSDDIADDSEFTAIQNGINAWTSVSGAEFPITYGGTTPDGEAVAGDGINTVTFSDTDYNFGQYVLAVGVATSYVTATLDGDKVYRPGMVVDADMIFNPAKNFKTATYGTFGIDIQSIATHEAGHLLGLSHSAVKSSTMFFVLPGGTQATSLETEDEVVFAKAYPNAVLLTTANLIEGTVTNGFDDSPLPGAIVFAISSASGDTLGCEYTFPDGGYTFFGLPDGGYYISIYPLDGTTPIGKLKPGYINSLVETTAVTLFVPEYYSVGDNKFDDPLLKDEVTVSGGSTASGIDIMTNIDNSGPIVVLPTSPVHGSTGDRIDTAVLIRFSESIDISTIQDNFRVREKDLGTFMTGAVSIMRDDSLISFTPSPPYLFAETYVCSLKTGLKDKFGNSMSSDFVFEFTTELQPPIAVNSLVPNKGVSGSIVVINGAGFGYTPALNKVLFPLTGAPPIEVVPNNASPNALVITVPPNAETGEIKVVSGPDTSNGLTFTILSPVEIARGHQAGVTTVGGVPQSLTVTPNGNYAYVATDEGFSSVVVNPGLSGYLNSTDFPIEDGLDDLDAIPNSKRVYAVSSSDSSIHVISSDPDETFQFNSVISSIFTHAEPLGIVIGNSGRKAYIPTLNGRIQIWDVLQGSPTFWKQIGEIVAPDPNLRGKITIDPTGQRLLALSGTGEMHIFHLGPDTLLASINVGTDPQDVVVDPAGQRAYVSDGYGTVTIIALGLLGDTPAYIQDITANGSLRGMTMTPTGQFIYAANRQLNTIDVIDLNEGTGTFRTVAATIEVANDPVDVDLSPDGFYAFSLIESSKQMLATTIGLGPELNSLSRYAGPEGAKVVLAGSGFGWDNNSIRVNFSGIGGTVIQVIPDLSTTSSILATVPAGAAPGAIDVTTWVSDLMDPVLSYSNALYFNVLPTDLPGTFRHAAKIIPGAYDYRNLIRVSPTGDQAAFRGGNDLVVLFDIDPESPTFHQVLQATDVSAGVTPNISDMAFTPDGKRLYVSEMDYFTTHYLDVDRHSPTYGDVLGGVTTGGSMPGHTRISPNGEWCLTHEGSQISFIDIIPGSLNENTIVDTIDGTLGLMEEFEFHPSGNYLYAMHSSLGIRVVDMRSWQPTFKRILNSVPLTWWHMPEGWVTMAPKSIAFTPNGERCLVSTYNGGLLPPERMIFTLDCSDPINPTVVGRYTNSGMAFYSSLYDEYLDVSPAGDRVLYHSNGNGFMYFEFMDPDTNITLLSMHSTNSESDHDFAPDGSRVYSVSENDSISIYDFYGGGELILELTSGSYQSTVVNQAFTAPLRVRVVKKVTGEPSFIFPVVGAAVNFVIDTGGGYFKDNNLMEQVAVTGSGGYAEVEWVYGPTPGCGQVSASASGLLNSPRTFIGCAVDDPESLPLSFSELLPTHTATNVSATTSILASFSRGVDPATVDDNTFYLYKDGETAHVPVVYGFTDANRKVSLSPSQALDFSTPYHIQIVDGPSGIKDLSAGELNTSVLYDFLTRIPPPLVLASVSPPSATVGVTLMLSGTGFDPVAANNTVFFNTLSAVPIEAGIDYLKVEVPNGAVSGTISVQTNAAPSNTKPFTVIIPTTSPVDEVLSTIGTGTATRSVVMTPDGTMAFTVSPDGDIVIPIDVVNEVSLPGISVGDHPISIAMHPEGTFAYVPNFNSNSLSIISVHPDSSDYLSVRTTLIVGVNPIDVAVSGTGDDVVVANSGSNNLSMIDGDNQSSSFHSVLATIGTGVSTKSVVMSPDGSRIYIGTDTGYIVMDADNHGVLATIGTGTATKSVVMVPDGTMLVILTAQGEVIIYNVDPNAGEAENSVLATLGKGSSTTSITMNPDGTLLYLIQGNSNTVLVVSLDVIGSVSALESGAEIPPFQVSLTVIDSVTAGQNPSAIAFDPSGSGLALICNAGDSTVTFLNASDTPAGPLTADIRVTPRTLNLESRGRWIMGSIELPGAYVPEDIDISTVLLQGTIAAETDRWEICDCDLDGTRELVVKFDRTEFQEVMPLGEYVPVTISGVARTRAFSGPDTIRTIRPQVTHPTGTAVAPNEPTLITWTTPAGYDVDSADVYWSPDEGESWECIVPRIPNTGHTTWMTPNVDIDSCRVMVTLYSGGEDLGMAMSPIPFSISETVAINLASFEGMMEGRTAVLQWKTTRERYVSGFHLLRSDSEEGVYTRITDEEISASGELSGSEYRYADETVKPNRTYYYQLEEISERGENQLFGPCKLTYIAKFALEQNVPNPFNPTTTIHFTLPEDAVVKLVIFDVAGRIVRTLLDEKRRADNYKVEWDGRDLNGDPVASGVYFYRIKAGKHRATRKMVLLK